MRRLSEAVSAEPCGNNRASCDSGEATMTQKEEPAAAWVDCSIAQPTCFDTRAWRSFSAARFTGAIDAIGSCGSRIRDTWLFSAAKAFGASSQAVTAPASFKKSRRAILEAAFVLTCQRLPSRPSIGLERCKHRIGISAPGANSWRSLPMFPMSSRMKAKRPITMCFKKRVESDLQRDYSSEVGLFSTKVGQVGGDFYGD